MTGHAKKITVSSDEALYLLEEQTRHLYRNLPPGLLAAALNATILAFVMRDLIHHEQLLIWLISTYLTIALRYFQLHRYRHDAATSPDAKRWCRWFITSTALSGIVWGAAGIFLFPAVSTAHQGFLALVLGGMAAGAAATYAVSWKAFLAFTLPVLIPLIIRLFSAGDEIHLAMGTMSFLFAIIIVIVGMRVHTMTLTSFKLLFENKSLIDYLASAKENAEKLNEELTAEITERKRGEEELRRHREHLQDVVSERTAELSASNRRLQQEIAERSRMEEALRKSEEHFRSLIENALDLITVLDEKGTILYESPSVQRIIGYKAAELIGKDVFAFVHPDDRETVLKKISKVVQQPGFSDKVELRLKHANGSWRTIEAIGKSIIDESNNVRIVVNSRDNTERRQLEENLFRMQKLESVGILAGGIAHDFNNLLTAIIGNIDIVATYMSPGDNQHIHLRKAENAALRARDLTQQLLTFAKGGEPVKKTVFLKKFIQESANFALRGADVRCEFSVPDNLWPVEVDEGQLNQVINNLIINADQAMPEGGIIRVRCENSSPRFTNIPPLPEGNYVKISIADQGEGISEENQGKVFDPYFTTKPDGHGLGLATSHSIIKKHGGHIDVESKAGGGATFTIYLPASREKAARTETAAESLRQGVGRILLMDDEELIREVADAMLRTLGYEVTLSREGSEAIDLYIKAKETEQPFTVVIMDLTIPGGMGGEEAVKKLLQIDPQAKVIVSSGYSNDPIMADFKEYGFGAVLIKPYKLLDLSETVHRMTKL